MIRPVEMQMIIPQANQVGMQQHNVNQHAAIQSAQGTTELEKEVQQNAETVIPKENADMMEFAYDAREQGSNTYDDFYAKRRKKRQEDSEKSDDKDKKKQGDTWVNFDVQV
ncbi:MAG: hypothetical protein IJ079_04615 [Lachnospiraceae bacterium]|nr:hypothetical protein [Lachnospiraceae bacterium]